MDYELTDYFEKKMSDRSLVEWVAEEDERIIATGAIIFMDFPPSFTNKTGKQGILPTCIRILISGEEGLPQRSWNGLQKRPESGTFIN